MIRELIDEYKVCAEARSNVDYSDKKSILLYNASSNRMRKIVDEVVNLGEEAISSFTTLLQCKAAAVSAAHHLVEKAELDSTTLSRCFALVEHAKSEAESEGNMADAMGEEMWLKEWKTRKM